MRACAASTEYLRESLTSGYRPRPGGDVKAVMSITLGAASTGLLLLELLDRGLNIWTMDDDSDMRSLLELLDEYRRAVASRTSLPSFDLKPACMQDCEKGDCMMQLAADTTSTGAQAARLRRERWQTCNCNNGVS